MAVLPSYMTLYEISVRQTRDLPVVSLFPHPASFRFHLTTDTLAFGYILPTTGWIRGFNPLETCAAGRTNQEAGHWVSSPIVLLLFIPDLFTSFTHTSNPGSQISNPAPYPTARSPQAAIPSG